MSARELFEKEMSDHFNKQQLEAIVLSAIGERLVHFTINPKLPNMITDLISELEKDQVKLIRLLLYLKDFGSSPEVRGATTNYLSEISGQPVQ